MIKKKVQKISERNIQALMEEYGKGKEKRVSLHAINEILSLQKHQAEILPNLDLPLLESFSRAAGNGFADVWIRREISEYANKQTALSTRNKNGKVITI